MPKYAEKIFMQAFYFLAVRVKMSSFNLFYPYSTGLRFVKGSNVSLKSRDLVFLPNGTNVNGAGSPPSDGTVRPVTTAQRKSDTLSCFGVLRPV
jgi:hypothetical protein